MKRRLSAFLWTGFVLVLVALFSYLPLFARFPATRDFPWVNLLSFLVGLGLIAVGIRRAYAAPARFRGKIIGAILGAVAVLAFAFFTAGVFHFARQLPAAKGAPQVGQRAPDFALPDQDGNVVTLASLLPAPGAGGAARAALLIFYRGFW